MEFNDLINKVKRYNKDVNVDLLEKAYKFSESLVSGKKRESGEPWIRHYIDVACEAANLKLDDASLAAALMHGILNKGADKSNIKRIFGEDVAEILENIERMTEVKKNVTKVSTSENLKKVLLAAAKDVRALLIKLCDKVVNLRDINYLNPNERKRIAKEAMEIYAPLAYRLGIGKLKSEIEDLAFKCLDEENYKKIEAKVNSIRKEGDKLIFKWRNVIEKELSKDGLKSDVQSRVKHLYGIYRKIVDRSYDVDNLKDIIGFRVIVNDVGDCYKALMVIHNNFRPLPNTFKDYIAVPKPNGYQSLHTCVADNEGRIFEVQIRTKEMHDISEEGIAAHFSYKKLAHGDEFDKKLSWLKQLVETRDSIGSFDVDFFGNEVFAFTPKGKAIELPKESTIIDFAYSVHSDLGDHCMGAKVNGEFVSLKERIDNGDIIEILTSKTQKPSREWLKFARTTKARNKIKQALKVAGKVATRIYSTAENNKKDFGESLLVIEGDKTMKIKLALCCKPVPGDKISGIKTSNIRLMVHRDNCGDISKTQKKKIKVGWEEKFKEPVGIIVNAKDRPGLLKEMLNNLSKLDVNITKAKGKAIGNSEIEYSFSADVGTLDKLNGIISRINKIKDVRKVYLDI